jgi:hypothetical protein
MTHDPSPAGTTALAPRPSSRTAVWIGFLAGGWMATLLVGGLAWFGGGLHVPATPAYAEDDATPGPITPQLPDPLDLFDGDDGTPTRSGIPNPGGGTSDSNNTAIALSASIGGGESVVYYFDTVNQRVLVYQYKGRLATSDRPLRAQDKGGLRLLAARHMDFDLRLEGYRDLSERTRSQLQSAYEATAAKKGKGAGDLPAQSVEFGPR